MKHSFLDRPNTILDDIAPVAGFSATLRISAWYGDASPLYVPATVAEHQILVRLLGQSAAQRMAQEFGGEYLAIPKVSSYDEDRRRHKVAVLAARGFSMREIARMTELSERRVQQICRELEHSGIIAPLGSPPKDECWMPPQETDQQALEAAWNEKRSSRLKDKSSESEHQATLPW